MSSLPAGIEREALAPVELDRRRGEKQRAAEIADVEAGLGDRLVRGGLGQFVGQRAGALVAGGEEVDGAGDAGVEMIGRESA